MKLQQMMSVISPNDNQIELTCTLEMLSTNPSITTGYSYLVRGDTPGRFNVAGLQVVKLYTLRSSRAKAFAEDRKASH